MPCWSEVRSCLVYPIRALLVSRCPCCCDHPQGRYYTNRRRRRFDRNTHLATRCWRWERYDCILMLLFPIFCSVKTFFAIVLKSNFFFCSIVFLNFCCWFFLDQRPSWMLRRLKELAPTDQCHSLFCRLFLGCILCYYCFFCVLK